MADLVISHFTNLKVGKDQVIDHIDCVPYHNWVTNLRVISRKENTKRANLYSYGLKLGTGVGKGFTDLDSIATVLNGTETGELEKLGTLEFIKNNPTIFGSMSIESSRSYIAKVRRGDKGHQVKLSKLKVLRKFKATIYDITVEDHHSYITYNFSKTRKGPQEEYNFINKNTPYGISGFYHSKWVEAITDSDSPFTLSDYIGKCTQSEIRNGMIQCLKLWAQEEQLKRLMVTSFLLVVLYLILQILRQSKIPYRNTQ